MHIFMREVLVGWGRDSGTSGWEGKHYLSPTYMHPLIY